VPQQGQPRSSAGNRPPQICGALGAEVIYAF
jgi:hypothetical protein